MSTPIPINLAVEDSLSDAVVRKLLRSTRRHFAIGATFSGGGVGYLKNKIAGFNNAAKGTPFFVLTDLDNYDCPPQILTDWLPGGQHPNLLFRVAVKEVETWLLADRQNLARFLSIRLKLLPFELESIDDPKRFLIGLAKESRSSEIRKDLVPPSNSDRKVGPNYNGRLIDFVNKKWSPANARRACTSLDRTIQRIRTFQVRYAME